MPTADALIQRLHLQPHPEGGFFAETYRAVESVDRSALPDRFAGSRAFSTGIYFLLKANQFSALHRIASDEMWHFYAGEPLEIVAIHPGGGLESWLLGDRLDEGCVYQIVVPAGCWFGAALAEASGPEAYALVGCTVAPGFDFDDFEMGSRVRLIQAHPEHREIIERLTRGEPEVADS